MARYIDADKLKDRMLNYYECVNADTNKSNYRGETLMNYEVADMIEDCIDNAPAADVVPKNVYDISQYLLGDAWKHVGQLDELCEKLQKSKSEIASEIFEEIEEIAMHSITSFGLQTMVMGEVAFANLKKKYTEEAANDS